MKWYVDYEDLSTCAVGVKNRHSTWRFPGRRGENAVVPGRDGSLWSGDKPFDEGEFALDMFAAGAEADGSIPKDEPRAIRVRRNLDRLTRIFGSDKLVTLAFVEDDTVPYGRRNVIPNPSFEAQDGKVVTRENVITNPSAETSTAKSVLRRNHAPNPGMDIASADYAVRRNLVLNPRMDTDGSPITLRTNLCPNPSFEVSTQHWAPAGAATMTRVATKFGTIWPPSPRRSLKLTAGSTSTNAIACGPCPVVPGLTYTLSAYVYNDAGASRNFRVVIQWRNRKGASISASNGGQVAVASGAVGRPVASAPAPAGATAAFVRLQSVAPGAAGENSYWDQVLFEQAGSAGVYFDGESDEIDGLRHDWIDEPGVSRSTEYIVAPSGYTSSRTLMATTANKMSGVQAAKVLCATTAAAGTLLFGQQVRYGADLSAGVASGLIHVRPGDSTARQVTVRLACYDAGRNYLGPLTSAPGVALADVVADLEPDSWTPIEYGGGTVQPNTDRVALEVRSAGANWTAGVIAYFDHAMVEPARLPGPYFDGTVADVPEFDFRWTADPHWSESEVAGARVDDWTAKGGVQYQVADGYLGDDCLRVEAERAPTGQLSVQADAIGHGAGDHVWSTYVRPSRTVDLIPFVVIDKAETTGAPVNCPAGAWTRLSQTGLSVLSAATKVSHGVRLAVPVDGDYFDVDAGLFEPAGALRPFFDGNSGKNYAWDKGASIFTGDRADGWSAYGSSTPGVSRSEARAAAGTYAVRVVARYAGDAGVTSGQDAVVAGRDQAFGVDVSVDTARTVRVGLRWLNNAGDEVGNTFNDTAVAAGAAFVRLAVTGTPPGAARVVTPYVQMLGAAVDNVMYVDRAVFGFGATTSYADGNTNGWRWKGDENASVSVLEAPRVDNWSAGGNATLTTSSAWSSDGDLSGLLVATGTGAYAQAVAGEDETGFSVVDDFFRSDPERDITFASDVRGREAGQVQVQLVPYNWDGFAMDPSTDASITSAKLAFAAGETVRPQISGRFSDATTHYLARVLLFDAAGGASDAGQGVYLDRAIAGFGAWDGAYFDGDEDDADWEGAENASPSRFYGAARVIQCEVRDAIDFDSVGGGTTARFAVRLKAPEVFFRDQSSRVVTLATSRSGMVHSLYGLTGTTARINDSVVRVYGPISNFQLTDVGSGAWVRVNRDLRAGQWVDIDNGEWTVFDHNGKSVIEDVRHAGSPVLLPITPLSTDPAPRIKITADSVGDGSKLRFTAHRKFYVA